MNRARRVLVTGASGMLGQTLVPVLRAGGFDVVAHGQANGMDVAADLTDAAATQTLLDHVKPEAIVNLVALTNVDQCEERPHLAYCLNVLTVETLAAWIVRNRPSHLIQISTDQVYDGAGPHRETAVTIANTYALSKYAGELAALNAGATVLRTNFFGPGGLSERASFSDWLIRKFRSHEAFISFDDVFFSPLSMETLSRMLIPVVHRSIPGVFNLGSHGGLSKAAFAAALAGHLGLDLSAMRRGTVSEVKLKAARPRDMRMDSHLFEVTFGVALPRLLTEIERLEGDNAPAQS